MQLPASFFAYRKQQHRWTCGPVQLWRKAAVDIWASSLPLHCKLDLILCYFGIRKVATHWVSMGFFCGLVPLSVFTPEVTRPLLHAPRPSWPPSPPPSPGLPSPLEHKILAQVADNTSCFCHSLLVMSGVCSILLHMLQLSCTISLQPVHGCCVPMASLHLG